LSVGEGVGNVGGGRGHNDGVADDGRGGVTESPISNGSQKRCAQGWLDIQRVRKGGGADISAAGGDDDNVGVNTGGERDAGWESSAGGDGVGVGDNSNT